MKDPLHRTLLFACALLLLASGPAGGCDGCDEEPQDDDSADDDGVILEVTAEVSPVVGSVVTVTWATSRPTAGRVEWTDGGSRASDADDATEHRVQLRGLRAGEEHTFEVVALEQGEEVERHTGGFTTSPLPPELEQIGVHTSGEPADGGYLFTPLVTGDEFPVILDRAGNVLWWFVSDEIPVPRILAVKPSCDGESVWFNSINAVDDEIDMAWLVRVSWDGTEVEHYELADHNHTFVEIPDGSVATLFHDFRDVEGEAIRGDEIVEVAPDGIITPVWSVWDHFEYDGGEYLPGTGWTHANALEYDPVEDAYHVSLRNLDCIVKVDRASGEAEWVLNGEHSDFAVVGEGLFAEQHEFELLGDRVLVFDNGTVARYTSRALEVELDTSAMETWAVWSNVADPPLFIPAGGDVSRLPSGNTLITWSTAGQIDEVTPEGERVWQLQTDLGAGVFYTVWQDDLYTTDLPGCGP